MLKSMTGFGRGEVHRENIKINLEIKSVNHRYCEIILHMPRSMNVLEERMKRVIKQKIARGRLDVYINIHMCSPDRTKVIVDESLAASYIQGLNDLSLKFDLTGQIAAAELLQLPGVVALEESEEDMELYWVDVQTALEQAQSGLIDMRSREGYRLTVDIQERLQRISAFVGEIEQRSSMMAEEYRERLHQKLHDLLELETLDPARLDTEVVILAERSSIAEEIVRLKSHLLQFGDCLELEEPVGRKLDFLLQELNREINTISSKSTIVTINRTVVEVKSELEKIREQIQNIE